MLKLVILSTVSILGASTVLANPWEVQAGSKLLDGTETATSVGGHMFSGTEYEFTISQVQLICREGEILMRVIGDSDIKMRDEIEVDPTINLMVKAGSEVENFKATITNQFSLEVSRVHDGPRLLDLLRRHDGSKDKAQVQIPVALTGIPEVRSLSLENVVDATDLILATCGPLEMWMDQPEIEIGPKTEETEMDLKTSIAVGLAQQVVKTLIVDDGVSLEEITKALKPLID